MKLLHVSSLTGRYNSNIYEINKLNVSCPRTKKSFFSADFSAKNWFLVGLETILGRKNQKKKIADFPEKTDFS